MRIENYSAEELFDQLNDIDETQAVEAKALSQDSTRSLRPILYKLVSPNGPLCYTHPEMLHHPLQAYVAKASGVEAIKKVTEEVTEKVIEKVTERQSDILALLDKNPGMTQVQLAEKIGISRRHIASNIKKLMSLGMLRRIGPDKGGHWEVVK